MKKIPKIVPKDSPEDVMLEEIKEHQSYLDYMIEDFKKKTKQLSESILDKVSIQLNNNKTEFDKKEMKRKVDREVIKKIISSL